MAAVADAGLQQIDHLITTHWHGDHVGGMTELAKRIPIGHFIDHGLNVQANPTTDAFLGGAYRDLWVANYYSARNPLRLSSLVILGVVARMFRCATRSSCWCT